MSGTPRQSVRPFSPARSIALSGQDFPGIRPDFKVEAGDRVRAGQTVFVDRKRPQIAFASPVSGTVAAIERGQRRMLASLVVEIGDGEAEDFSHLRDDIRPLLLAGGLWPSFLARPFGRIPDPDARPDAIFVTAIDTNPLAPNPNVAIDLAPDDFALGVEMLLALTEGPVFVCQGPGRPLLVTRDERVKAAFFNGPHPAGLAGTHIHLLAPVGGGKTVWTIGYQDVIAIGHLVETGKVTGERTVSIAGSGVRNPALCTLPIGASLDDVLDGQMANGPARVISGSVLSGRETGYLGRYHNQVTVLADDDAGGNPLSRLLARGPASAIVPTERFEASMPLDILPVPLLRALAVGDVETARDLGCLELVEEDMALMSHICASATDYGALLRETLDQIAGEI